MTLAVYRLLLRRLGFAPGARIALGGVCFVVAVSTTLYLSLCALALSKEQMSDKALGRSDFRITANLPLGDRMSPGLLLDLQRAVSQAGGVAPVTTITSTTLQPDQLPAQHTSGIAYVVRYLETRSLQEAAPGRYRLAQGRWGTAAREVTLSSELWRLLGQPRRISLGAGAVRLDVVGVHADRYALNDWQILAADGTFESMPAARLERAATTASGELDISWRGGEPQVILKALLANGPRSFNRESMQASLVSRSAQQPQKTLVNRSPAAVTLPAALLVGALAALAVVMEQRRLRQRQTTLRAIGISRRPAELAVATVDLVGVVGASVLGGLMGTAVAALARGMVLPRLAYQPLSPMANSSRFVGALVAVAFGVSLVLIVWGRLRQSRRSGLSEWLRRALPISFGRRLGATLALLWCLPNINYTNSQRELAIYMGVVVAAVLALVPDVAASLLRVMPSGRLSLLLAVRQGRNDRLRYGLVSVLVAAGVSVPAVMATYTSTQVATAQADLVPLAPPGWLVVDCDGAPQRCARIRKTVQDATSAGKALELRMFIEARRRGKQVAVTPGSTGSGHRTLVLVVRTTAEVERFLGRPLSAQERAVVEGGGAVEWVDLPGDLTLDFTGQDRAGAPTRLDQATLPTVHVHVDRSTKDFGAGIILEDTVHRLAGRSSPFSYVFTDTDATDVARGVAAIRKTGDDARFLRYYVAPRRVELGEDWFLSLVGLTLGSLMMIAFAMHAQARSLRAYSARLLAIGFRQSWSVKVLLVGASMALLAGLAASIPAVALPLGVWAASIDDIVFDVPWPFVLSALTCTVLAVVLATLVALLGLSAGEGDQAPD